MKRAIWALVVVCLMAASGAPPVSAAELARRCARGDDGAHAQLGDPRPGLPAVTAARHASLVVAIRARTTPAQLPPVMLAAPPAIAGLTVCAIAETCRRGTPHDQTLLPIRSARGPPVR